MPLVITAQDKIWEGELPKGFKVVLQFWSDKTESWQPPLEKGNPRDRKDAIEGVEKAIHKGPLHYQKYRLVPVEYDPDTNSIKEITDMTAKKSAKKSSTKKSTTPKEEVVLVGGRFREGSDVAKMYTLLSDGKARSIAEIQKVVHAKVEKNIGVGKYTMLKKHGQISGEYDMKKTDDGKIQMVFAGKGSKSSKPASKKGAKKTSRPPQEAQEESSEIQVEA